MQLPARVQYLSIKPRRMSLTVLSMLLVCLTYKPLAMCIHVYRIRL